VATSSQRYLAVTFPLVTAASDITYRVDTSADLQTWLPGCTYSGTNRLTATEHTTEFSHAGAGLETITVGDNTPMESASQRFLRLKVTEPRGPFGGPELEVPLQPESPAPRGWVDGVDGIKQIPIEQSAQPAAREERGLSQSVGVGMGRLDAELQPGPTGQFHLRPQPQQPTRHSADSAYENERNREK